MSVSEIQPLYIEWTLPYTYHKLNQAVNWEGLHHKKKKKKISLVSHKTKKSVMELFISPLMKACNKLRDKLILSISQWKKLSHLLRKKNCRRQQTMAIFKSPKNLASEMTDGDTAWHIFLQCLTSDFHMGFNFSGGGLTCQEVGRDYW